MNKPVVDVVHFSDVLCIWAYIAQIRIEELQASFPTEVRIDYRFMQVFGDVAGKMESQWADRGGLEGYAEHVRGVAARFEHVKINPQLWLANTPTSSLPAHLVLCGAKAMYAADPDGVEPDLVQRMLRSFRAAFFVELIDISNHQRLLEVAEQTGADITKLQQTLRSGAAHAQLTADLAAVAEGAVRASPTMTFNEGRQTLSGNVGYRVIEANVRELLRSPEDQQSWC